ncbi:MAG: DUF7003 family protein [Bacteroidia bacterium]
MKYSGLGAFFIFLILGCNLKEQDNSKKKDVSLKSDIMTNQKYNEDSVLKVLDNIDDSYLSFLDLGHSYFALSGSRINLFADETRWAIVFEKTGCNVNNNNVEIELTYFGNCLTNMKYLNSSKKQLVNSKFITLVETKTMNELVNENGEIKDIAKIIMVRNTELKIEHKKSKYEKQKINLLEYNGKYPAIDATSMIRYLDETNAELFRATDQEIRTSLPADLFMIMKIDKWHHERYFKFQGKVDGKSPSTYETFQQIAKVLVTKNPSYYKPTLPANNDWRNWPEAGNL